MAGHGKAPKVVDQDSQLKDIKRQLGEQLGCLDCRMESKISLLAEFQEFFRRRGEVEYEYARSLERLCEKFERNTKQRNIRNEVRSTFNFWSTLLAETRKTSRARAWMGETIASEMVARLDVMTKDVQMLTKKCKEVCSEIQDLFSKELRDLSEQTKVYQHSSHNTSVSYLKACKSKEKMEGIKGAPARRKKAEEKYKERQTQFKVQKHLLLKNRNDYLLGIARCNALSTHYFSNDVMDIIGHMDFDYHSSFQRLAVAYRDSEREACESLMQSGDALVEQSKSLNLENDLHYFLSEYSSLFTAPNYFQFSPFEGDDVNVFKVNTEDVFKRWSKTMADLKDEIETLKIQREEDTKIIEHMKQVNLKKYQVTSADDAFAVIEENGDTLYMESSRDRGNASLERGLSLTTKAGQAIIMSQKGKKDTLNFTLQILQRRILRADRLSVACALLEILEKTFQEQKVPPVPVGLDAHGRAILGEVPQLFGGDLVSYVMATGCEIPLIVESCVGAIEQQGLKMEGLFRVPGPAALLDELRLAFEEGRDPLAGSTHKLDMAAVASMLKAYFRELSTPLFPTDMYTEFIHCARHDTIQGRLDALSATIHSLPPQTISVMQFLFRFLYRVSLHAADNKMGSANLALVFGPTLTRAPDSIDPRQLHNDVPSVNMLIQMCIDRHIYIFGDEVITSPFPDDCDAIKNDPPLSTSPPAEPPSAPAEPPSAPLTTSSTLDSSRASSEQLLDDEDLCELPPPPCPPRLDDTNVQLPTDDIPLPPHPPRPEAVSPPPSPHPPKPEAISALPPPTSLETDTILTSIVLSPPPPLLCEEDGGANLECDTSGLDATMQEIAESLQELGDQSPVAVHRTVVRKSDEAADTTNEAEDEDDDDSDSEDEGDGMRIGARALYDYEARSDKELTFSRGNFLQVITKTPDNNWWDGFHGGKRGFIPVAYVEVTELKPSPSPSPCPATEYPMVATLFSPASQTATFSVPAPPERKSSIPVSEGETVAKVSEVPREPVILEEDSDNPLTPEPVFENMSPVENASVSATTALTQPHKLNMGTDEAEAEVITEIGEEKVGKLSSAKSKGSVKSLTKQFQEPEVMAPKVLVEPIQSHRRQHSDHYKFPPPVDDLELMGTHRSCSSGNKVSMLSSTFETKTCPSSGPPPLKPKPSPMSSSVPSSDAFPLVFHGNPSVLAISPLQRAVHQSQQVGQKPAVTSKKPLAPVVKATGKSSTKAKLKKKDSLSLKEKEKEKAKPVPTPKPGFVASPAEIQAEFQARVKRKQSEDMTK